MRFDVTFRELDEKLNVDFRTRNEKIKVDFEHFQIVSDHEGVEYYKGDYTVTPKVEKQELATRQKFLTENVKNQRDSILRGFEFRGWTNCIYWKGVVKKYEY